MKTYHEIVKHLEKQGYEVRLWCEPEEVQIEGNALASGDSEEDAKQEAWIRDQLESGNEWAWCRVVVTVTHPNAPDVEGRDNLGCCSYLSREDFQADGGYAVDMVKTALAELIAEVPEVAGR